MRKWAGIAFLFIFFGYGAFMLWQWSFPAIYVAHPTIGPSVRAVYGTGTVEATSMLPISARLSARLTQLFVDEGEKVTKGQILAQLEDDELQHTMEQLQIREDFARKEHERSTTLIQKNIASQQTFERTKSEWEAAQAATKAAKAQADDLKLTAPEAGTIIRRDGEVGQLIPTNTPIFWMSCCGPLRVLAEIDEEDIALVSVGQSVLLRADAFPQQIFHGKVQSITPKGDPIARSYRVRIELAPDLPLQIGMSTEVNIIIEERLKSLLLPHSAIQKDYVWGVREHKLHALPIRIGIRGQERTEILEGLTQEEWVVLAPEAHFQEGQRVREIPAPSSKDLRK